MSASCCNLSTDTQTEAANPYFVKVLGEQIRLPVLISQALNYCHESAQGR